MADFDQLLREKAEQAQIKYKPSAWRAFAKRAGFKPAVTPLQLLLGTGAVLLVAGGVTWGVLSHNKTQTPTPNDAEVVEVVDTLTERVEEAPVEVVATPVAKSTVKSATASQKVETPAPDTVTPVTPVAKPTPKKKERQPYMRAVTISPDTIKQNVPTDEQLRNGNSRIL